MFNENKPVDSYQEALSYLQQNQERLVNGYKTPMGHNESCTLVAFDVAELLVKSGREPYLLSIRGRVKDSAGNTETLKPELIKGDITWGGHVVCAYDNMAYDPVVGEPMEVKQYLENMFNDGATAHISMSPEVLKERLKI